MLGICQYHQVQFIVCPLQFVGALVTVLPCKRITRKFPFSDGGTRQYFVAARIPQRRLLCKGSALNPLVKVEEVVFVLSDVYIPQIQLPVLLFKLQ